MEKRVSWEGWEYRAFPEDPEVEIFCNQGLVEIEPINPEWKNYAYVTPAAKGFYIPFRAHDSDLFYFNYKFYRSFTFQDYLKLKARHKKIIFGIHYTSIHLPPRIKYWNHNRADAIARGNPLAINYIENLGESKYKKTILGKIPYFLFDTDCLFFILDDHEIVDARFYYHIMNNIHDMCQRKNISPERFFLFDNSIGELDRRKKEYYHHCSHSSQINVNGLPRFEAMTSISFSGHGGDEEYTPEELNFDLQRRRNKRFLFLNRRPRAHRTGMILKLYENQILTAFNNFYFSWGGNDGCYDSDFHRVFPDIDTSNYRLAGMRDEDQISKIKKHPFFENAPYFLDMDLNMKEEGPPYFGPFSSNREIYPFVKDSYISLVSETDLSHHYTFLTEKTFKRFAWRHPFLLWGNPYSLKCLREMGYKTFGKWFNEEYDSIIDSKERFDSLYEEIERLSRMSIPDIHKIYLEMIPTLEYNFHHFNHSNVLERSFNRMILNYG